MFRAVLFGLQSLNPLKNVSFSTFSLKPSGLLVPVSQNIDQNRTVTKYSHRKGTRKTVRAAIRRNYRLNCGLWIHALPCRSRKLWRRTPEEITELRKHVFATRHHHKLLDKMTRESWKYPKYYPDSPYEPYDNFKPPDFVYKPWK